MKEKFSTRKGPVEKVYSVDHLEAKNVIGFSSRKGGKMVVCWKCNICGKIFSSSFDRQDVARMKSWDCAESHK